MGVSFRFTGCIKFTGEGSNEICAIKITTAPRRPEDQSKARQRDRRAPFRGLISLRLKRPSALAMSPSASERP